MVSRLWTVVSILNQLLRRGHEESAMAPWWVLKRPTKFTLRAMIKYLFLCSLAALFSPISQAISLQELEQSLLVNERRMQISTQDSRIASSLLQQRKAESGWKAFTNANGGSTTSSLSNPSMQPGAQYGTHGYTAGLSYPLLGNQTTQQKRIMEAKKKQVETSKFEFETVKRQALQDLRQSYIDLWVSQQQVELAPSYLDHRQQSTSILSSRKNAGLLLPLDEKQFQAGFAEVDSQKELAIQLNSVAKNYYLPNRDSYSGAQ
jgi:outer membrane protein TolC